MTTASKNAIISDTRAYAPDVIAGKTRAGVTGIRKMTEIARNGKPPVSMMATFDLFTDLPACHGELNLSGDAEALDRMLEALLRRPAGRVDGLCIDISRHLLAGQEYATIAEVRMRGEYLTKKRSPVTGLDCQAACDIYAGAVHCRDGNIRKTIEARVTAMTACPCAQEIFRGIAFEKLVKLGVSDDIATAFLDEMPMPTHNQRGIGTISIRCGEEADVCLDTIVDIIENSMSSPVYELLKREDEKYVVERAHRNPKFVEDCVRAMARDLVCRLPDLPDDASIAISQVNEESIHRHNAFAERTALFGELKKEIRRNSR